MTNVRIGHSIDELLFQLIISIQMTIERLPPVEQISDPWYDSTMSCIGEQGAIPSTSVSSSKRYVEDYDRAQRVSGC